MMLPEESVQARRALTTLDSATRDALVEIGNFVGGAADAALRSLDLPDIRVRSESCQGVKPGVRPAFVCEEGAELRVGRAQAQLAGGPLFELILMLPLLEPLPVASAAPLSAAAAA
jgi:hypothetical protein